MGNKQEASLVAVDIAEVFETGVISHHKLDPLGISSLAVRWKTHSVVMEWYPDPGGRVVRFCIDGSNYPGGGVDSDLILVAAKKRAENVLVEKMASLESELEG